MFLPSPKAPRPTRPGSSSADAVWFTVGAVYRPFAPIHMAHWIHGHTKYYIVHKTPGLWKLSPALR